MRKISIGKLSEKATEKRKYNMTDRRLLKLELSKLTNWPRLKVSDWSSKVQEVFNLEKPPVSTDYYYILARSICKDEIKKRNRTANLSQDRETAAFVIVKKTDEADKVSEMKNYPPLKIGSIKPALKKT